MLAIRALETEECVMLQKMARRRGRTPICGGALVAFRQQGNFTVALLHYAGEPFVGVTKRNPGDLTDPEFAERLALHRALEAALGEEVT